MNKKTITLAIVTAIFFGVGGFFAGNLFATPSADAEEHQCVVDRPLLEKIYGAVFHRPLDKGADFHLNKDIDTVLSDVEGSEEQDVYGALFNALKAYEEAIRAEGELSEEDEEKYLDIIDQALAQAVAWAEELPEQSDEDRVVGPQRAIEAITAAYNRMNPTARENARGGLMRALGNLGSPDELPLPGDFPEEDDSEEDDSEEDETTVSLTAATSAASSVTDTSAELNGDLSVMEGATEATVYFEWKASADASWNSTTSETLTETGVFSATLSELTAETQYDFRAVAESGDVTATGETLNFTTEQETSEDSTS